MATALLAADDLPAANAPLLVAFSGGLDSTVLLHALAALPEARARGLRAVHVHHGLQRDADAWARHCEAFGDQLGVAVDIARVQVPQAGTGPEAAARSARYAAFATALRAGEVLVLAHHREDQAETFLLRALRGSGVDGLAAMQAWRPFVQGWLWRPLLARSRAQLEAYARLHALRWLEDPSNAELAFDRNFLRHAVLPLLRERWPQAEASFARSAALLGQAHALLQEEDARLLAAATTDAADSLDLRVLHGCPPARRARVLRAWVAGLGLPPLPAQGVAHAEADLLAARADATPRFAWAGAELRRWRHLLHAGRPRAPLPAAWQAPWAGDRPLPLPGGGQLRLEGAPAFAQPVLVRARRGGERITLPGRAHSHALKHLLQERGVPPWTRERLPLLCAADGNLLAAGDLVIGAVLDDWLRTHAARLGWVRD